MGLRRTVDATVEPVSLPEMQAHLRINDDIAQREATHIRGLITVARQQVEEWEWRAHISQTWQWKLDAFPCGDDPAFYVPRPRLISVSSIAYTDTAGAPQTMDAADYVVDGTSEPGRIVPAYGESWPTPRSEINAVTVTFVAGYGTTPESVPEATRHIIKLLAAHYYENREPINIGAAVNEIPLAMVLLRPAEDVRALTAWVERD